MKIQFVVDGKVFEDKKEALEYEQKIKAEKEEKKKKAAEKQTREKEVEDAYNKYVELLDKYLEDYGSYTKKLLSEERDDYPMLSSLLRVFDLV